MEGTNAIAPQDRERIEQALETIRNTDPKQLSPQTRERAVRLFDEAMKLLKKNP